MSNGPIPATERSSSGIKSSSPVVLLTAGVAGAVIGLLSSYLVGHHGEMEWEYSSPLLWPLVVFVVIVTVSVPLIIFYLSTSQSSVIDGGGGEEASKYFSCSPAHPNRLQRVRSYLTFFPITHVIQSNNNGESGGDSLHSDPDEPGGLGLTGRINVQMDMAIEAIVSEYISPWYTKISDDGSFLEQCKTIIHTVFLHLGERLRQVDRNDLAKESIQILHMHWKEYTDAVAKSREQGNVDEVHKSFRFVHPFLQDNKEVSQRYQKLVSKVLKELGVPDLSSPVMCQFLAGILVKNFILFYVELICQPSWVNGSLMTLLSSGALSVDITGSSSQNSSSPASPLPEPSPKQVHLFGDEVMNDCASVCQSLTGNDSSSPTKTSCYSQPASAMSGSGGSQEDEFSKCEQQANQRSLESNSSASVDEGTSSEPKTESSHSRPSPMGKGLEEDNKWSSSTSSSSMFPTEILQPLSRRPKDLTPLRPLGPMRTVTTALGRVMQATAFPLLPSECYTEDCSSSITLPDNGKPLEERVEPKGSNMLEHFRQDSIQEEEDDIMLTTRDSVFEHDDDMMPMLEDMEESKEEREHTEEESGDNNKQGSTSPSTSLSNKTVTSHYYSFDEASKRKLSPSSFFETSTLSLDGAMEGRLKQEKDQLQLCSHEYKHGDSGDGHTPTTNGKPQRSPVYEEPEDFAASIAKLRSLLEQKGRKSSTPPNSACLLEDGEVFESPSDSPAAVSTGGSAGTIPQISETCASDTHTTPSSTSSMDISKGSSRFSFNETILIPSESDSTSLEPQDNKNYDTVPEIKCCFRNVSIPKVENSADAGGQYIYYCIQYEGVYFDEYDAAPQKLVYRTTTIKRKFKEFLTLQAHLEENAACKSHLKGIKTPTRWLNVSLTKSDATVAHQRRAMLEKYLQQLCYHPVIGFCQEVLIFMAYGEDGFCSFEVGDPKDLLTHRLDKLAKKFTGVINSLKDALPSFELDLTHAPHTPKSEGITPSDPKTESNFPTFSFQEKYSELGHHHHHHHQPGDDLEEPWMDKNWNGDNTDLESPSKEQHDKMIRDPDDELANGSSSPTNAPSTDVDGTEPGKIFSVYPLAAAVTHLLCDVLWLPQYRPNPTSVATFMSISGKSLENYVLETMDIFLSEEAILGYLEWLTISINTGQSDTDSQRCDVSSDLFSEQDLKNILKRRIPAWVRWMWGRNRLDLTIDRLTGLFQSPLVNHDLVLSLSELLFSKMVTLVDELDTE